MLHNLQKSVDVFPLKVLFNVSAVRGVDDINSVGLHLAYRSCYLFRTWNFSRPGSIQGWTLLFPAYLSYEVKSFSQESAQQQKEDSSHFLPVPGSTSNAIALSCPDWLFMCLTAVIISEIW